MRLFAQVAVAAVVMSLLVGGTSRAETTASSSQSDMKCQSGPVKKTFGGTPWLVFGCDDHVSLLIRADNGSSGSSFYFVLFRRDNKYHLHGEGLGGASTDRAYKDLAALTQGDIAQLLQATR